MDNNAYKEQHNLIKAVFNKKKMALGSTHHHINLQVGYDKFNSSLSREDYRLATHQSYQKLDYTPPSNPLPDKFKPILGSNNKPICLDAYGYGHDHPQACNAKKQHLSKFCHQKRHRAIQPKKPIPIRLIIKPSLTNMINKTPTAP